MNGGRKREGMGRTLSAPSQLIMVSDAWVLGGVVKVGVFYLLLPVGGGAR